MKTLALPVEEAAVEKIVNAVVRCYPAETGVDIEVEGEAGDEGGEWIWIWTTKLLMDDDPAMMDDPAMREAMMIPQMREDDDLEGMRDKKDAAKRDDDEDAARSDERVKKTKKMKKEELDLEVIDDEELTEAVLREWSNDFLSVK